MLLIFENNFKMLKSFLTYEPHESNHCCSLPTLTPNHVMSAELQQIFENRTMIPCKCIQEKLFLDKYITGLSSGLGAVGHHAV